METSLHRELKGAYAASSTQTEVAFGKYRIDAIGAGGELVEIQHASLGALKGKVRHLLDHPDVPRLRIVKPIVQRKWIVTRSSAEGKKLRRRLSPKRGQTSDFFLDLVYFSGLFPHPRLTLEVALVDVEEERAARPRRRFRSKNYVTLQQSLVAIHERFEMRQASDLWHLLPEVALLGAFDTAELARQIDRPRWFAQKVVYCMRNALAISPAGKRGNSQLYLLPAISVEAPTSCPVSTAAIKRSPRRKLVA